MSKIAIIEIYPQKKGSLSRNGIMIDAHYRNAIEISNVLNADLLVSVDDFNKAMDKKYDALVLAYASFYAPFQTINELCKRNPNAKKFVLSNEYNKAESIGGFKPFELISNYEKLRSTGSVLKHHFLNLNLLLAKQANEITGKKYDVIYYGTFRINRSKYFRKYLKDKIYLSTSSKNLKKYKHIGCNPIFINKLQWVNGRETLNRFRFSLYIEDEYTHQVFNNLANRFYEALFCNVILFFDINCKNTVIRSGINFDDFYYVSNYEELLDKVDEAKKDLNKHLLFQRQWLIEALEQKKQLFCDLKNIIC